MRIGKVTRWTLTIGVFAILLVAGAVNYGRQQAEQTELKAAITQANVDLVKYSAQRKDLEAKQREASSHIASVQEQFRQCTQSIEITEALFQAAKDAGVSLTNLSTSPPAQEKVGSIVCTVFPFTVTAQAEVLPGLLLFTQKVSDRFSTAAIKSARIEAGGEKPRMVVELRIYAYEKQG